MKKPKQILPGLYQFFDTCNVFVICRDNGSLAIDFGSGEWLEEFEKLNLPPLEKVLITHHHADQCQGLLKKRSWPFEIHAPAGERTLLEPEGVKEFWANRRNGGVPASYSVLPRGLRKVTYNLAGFSDFNWRGGRLRFLDTPGHGRGAVTIFADVAGKQVAFCGDAAHAGATVWKPFNLDWDHWTGSGALAAYEGITRLAGPRIDLLCPSHGPVINEKPRAMLKQLAKRLLSFYEAKGSICPDEPDRYHPVKEIGDRAQECLPGLYHFGVNGYLLMSESGEALVIDAYVGDIPALEDLLDILSHPRMSAATATHYHSDHSDGLPIVKKRWKARTVLHPRVAQPLRKIGEIDCPWLPQKAIRPDELMPRTGKWKWNEFTFAVAPFPGQTWWHAAFMTEVAGNKVCFSGDNYQPATRWNGTGGFSSFNGSRFIEGFVVSSETILKWKPDLVFNGHNTQFRFSPSYHRKVIAWAKRSESVTKALCPSGNLEKDYYLHPPMR